MSTVPTTKVPVHLYSKQLLHNAKLATSAIHSRLHVAEQAFLRNHISLYAAYYLMRKTTLAHLHPGAQLQNALCSTLRTYSEADVERLQMLYQHLCAEVHSRERVKHGIHKPMSDWTREDKSEAEQRRGHVIAQPWQYLYFVVYTLMHDRRSPGKNELERMLGVTDTGAV